MVISEFERGHPTLDCSALGGGNYAVKTNKCKCEVITSFTKDTSIKLSGGKDAKNMTGNFQVQNATGVYVIMKADCERQDCEVRKAYRDFMLHENFAKLGNCFSGATIVKTKRGEIPMAELQVGDHVMCFDPKSQERHWSEVMTFIHRDPELVSPFLCFNIGNKTALRVSTNHRVFLSDGTDKLALELFIGDSLILLDGSFAKITEIETICSKGVFAPLTSSGVIVADGVVCSCHADLPHSWCQVALWWMRAYKWELPDHETHHWFTKISHMLGVKWLFGEFLTLYLRFNY